MRAPRGTTFLLTAITAGLVLSHAAAWWLGSAFPEADQPGTLPDKPTLPAAGPAQWTTADLLRRAHRRQADEEARARSAAAETERSYEDRIAAARAKLPPGTDPADYLAKAFAKLTPNYLPKAILEFRSEEPLRPDEQPGMESAAAFGMWLDADPAAALAWAGPAARDFDLSGFSREVARWLAAGAYRRLGEYLDRFPLTEDLLLGAARMLAQEREPALAVTMAASLQDSRERLQILLLSFMLGEERMKGQMAAARALLQERDYRDFLLYLLKGIPKPGADMVDEIRQAGFPPALVAAYEKGVAEGIYAAAEASGWVDPSWLMQRKPAEPEPFESLAEEHHLPPLREQMPDLDDLQSAMVTGRMPPEDAMARFAEAWPESRGNPELQQEIRGILAGSLSEAAPVEALRWLRESGTPQQYSRLLEKCFFRAHPEQSAAIIADLPAGTELSEDHRGRIKGQIGYWDAYDTEGFDAAVERMAADDTQLLMATFMREEQEASRRERETQDPHQLELERDADEFTAVDEVQEKETEENEQKPEEGGQ